MRVLVIGRTGQIATELLPRLDAIELTGDAKLSVANFVSGLKSMPIRYALK